MSLLLELLLHKRGFCVTLACVIFNAFQGHAKKLAAGGFEPPTKGL
jgi:hypothetical protein